MIILWSFFFLVINMLHFTKSIYPNNRLLSYEDNCWMYDPATNNQTCLQCYMGYGINDLGQCTDCGDKCIKCSWNESQKNLSCQQCWSGTTLGVQKNCVDCPNNCYQCHLNSQTLNIECSSCYYGHATDLNGQCVPCDQTCQYCSFNIENNSVKCDQCYFGYATTENGTCKACGQNCFECTYNQQTTNTDCTLCSFEAVMNQQRKCISCGSGCIDCSYNSQNSSAFCKQCNQSSVLSSKGICLICDIACADCVYDSQKQQAICKNCLQGLVLTSQGKCFVCPLYCKKCVYVNETGETQCKQCQSSFLIFNNSCIYQYSYSGSIVLWTLDSYILLPCPSSCETCRIRDGTYECTQFNKGFGNKTDPITLLSAASICHKNCHFCSGSQLENCIGCVYGYVSKDQSCERCDDLSDGKCIECKFSQTSALNCYSCQIGSYLFENSCLKCIQNCFICEDASSCNWCIDGFFLVKSSLTSKNQCVQCISGCLMCSLVSNQIKCDACAKGYFLGQNSICLSCSQNCESCLSSQSCFNCKNGYQIIIGLITSRCVKKIPNCDKYEDNGTCRQCLFGYKVVNETTCMFDINQSIVAGLYYFCEVNQYLKNFVCQNVSNPIQNCIQYNQLNCIRCSKNFYLTYLSENKLQCVLCPPGCETCRTSESCSTCLQGYLIDQWQRCLKCSQNCKSCDYRVYYCTSCQEGFQLTKGATCVSFKRFRFIIQLSVAYQMFGQIMSSIRDYVRNYISRERNNTLERQLLKKYSNLQKVKSKSEASTQIQGFISYPDADSILNIYNSFSSNVKIGNQIYGVKILGVEIYNVQYCQYGKKYNNKTKKCQDFRIQYCKLYDQSTFGLTCMQCQPPLELLQDNTLCSLNCLLLSLNNCSLCRSSDQCQKCEQGFLIDPNTRKCKTCGIANCSKCEQKSDGSLRCIQCFDDFLNGDLSIYKIIDNQCKYLENRYNGYVVYEDSVVKCMEGCSTCLTPYQCQNCQHGYFGQTSNQSQICLKCSRNCSTCDTQGCIACHKNFYLEQQSKSCLKCSVQNCLNCTQNGFICTLCSSSYYISSNKSFCIPCTQNCKKCINNQCISCQIGFMLLYNTDGTKKCSQCIDSCAKCNMSQCIECFPGYYFDENGDCAKCNDACGKCSSKQICQACLYGYVKVQNSCALPIQGCYIYFSNTTCKTCYFEYSLDQNGKCSQKADSDPQIIPCDKDNFLQYGSSCSSCPSTDQYENCKKCNSGYCQSCQQGYFITTVWQQNYVVSLCKPCQIQGCSVCQSDTFCKSCMEGYYLNLINSDGELGFQNGSLVSKLNSIGVCFKCSQNCLTCYQKKFMCSSCDPDLILSESRVCLGSHSFNFTLRLDCEQEQFFAKINQLNEIFANLITSNKSLEQRKKLIQFYRISEGSIVLYGRFSSKEPDEIKEIYSSFNEKITLETRILGMYVLSVSVSHIYNAETFQLQQSNVQEAIQKDSNNKSAIIGGVVGGFLLVLTILIGIYLWLKRQSRIDNSNKIKKDDIFPEDSLHNIQLEFTKVENNDSPLKTTLRQQDSNHTPLKQAQNDVHSDDNPDNLSQDPFQRPNQIVEQNQQQLVSSNQKVQVINLDEVFNESEQQHI